MGLQPGSEIDAWLRGGGLVVTASDRAARAIAAAYHRARRADGVKAWPAPDVQAWHSYVRNEWDRRALDGCLVLNPAQEQALWAGIVETEKGSTPAALLEGPRQRLAAMAREAHERLATYAPRYLRAAARSGWEQDAEAFSGWLAAFDEGCGSSNLLSANCLPLKLNVLLENENRSRRPLLLAGFDRILAVQRAVFDAWGHWHEAVLPAPATQTSFYGAEDPQAELAACAQWCAGRLDANPSARLLVITQDASQRRGEIERAFLKCTGSASAPLFEFSLGVPLSEIALTRGAHLLLRWLTSPLAEHELDWLISTGQTAAGPGESRALQAYMRELRSRGMERTEWTLSAFLSQPPAAKLLPEAWVRRMIEAQQKLDLRRNRPESPLQWAELVPQLLEAAGWPGDRPLSSAEFQAFSRWQQALDTCGSLGFDGRRIGWQDFVSLLRRTLDETLYAPESRDAPIQIAGPAESAGLTADAIWFLGADASAWPSGGATHPLLPLAVQREAGMPHATAQLDWDLADAITHRMLASAPVACFSYARQTAGAEARPSRIVRQLAGEPSSLPAELIAQPHPAARTVEFADFSRIPLPGGAAKVAGGAGVLTAQSQCPFKAFATARLSAQGWEPAEAGLTAAQRGRLLHAVLHATWAGQPDGLRSHHDLQNVTDLRFFVAGHVRRVLREEIPAGLRERMPRRYLELEELRLVELVTTWLEFEATRQEFAVDATEVESAAHIAGLTLDVRLDRVDRLNDGSLLVVDYKTGNVSPSAWDPPRPDDVQLPLYAGFALDPEDVLGGLVYAKVRSGDICFAGRVGDARRTLLGSLGGTSSLVKLPFGAEQLLDWRECIDQLARDFVAGRAEVDPKEYPKTCERCGLQTLCRIEENADRLDGDEELEGEEVADD
jgi:probable DNA repair protein